MVNLIFRSSGIDVSMVDKLWEEDPKLLIARLVHIQKAIENGHRSREIVDLPSYKMVDLSIVVLGLFSRGYVICWMSWKQKHVGSKENGESK